MELVILLAVVGYAGWWIGRRVFCYLRNWHQLARLRNQAAARAKLDADQRRAQAYARDQNLRTQNHEMQTALLELPAAPDFQRAAWFAAKARDVPITFRQRQFHRFRTSILHHLVSRLQSGAEREPLRQSLVELVTHLGLAPFEADYLWREADAQLQALLPAPPYATEMARLEREHEQRLAVLHSLAGVGDDLREQLIEAEEERFRQAMLTVNEEPAPELVETQG